MLETILTTKQLPIWAEQYAESVVQIYAPDSVILFGSVAREIHQRDSDINILVIGGNLPLDYRERFRALLRLRPLLAPIQVHTYTRAEWDRMMADRHVTALEALNDGRTLHGRALHGQALFVQWRRQFLLWQEQGLHRTDCTWVLPTNSIGLQDAGHTAE